MIFEMSVGGMRRPNPSGRAYLVSAPRRGRRLPPRTGPSPRPASGGTGAAGRRRDPPGRSGTISAPSPGPKTLWPSARSIHPRICLSRAFYETERIQGTLRPPRDGGGHRFSRGELRVRQGAPPRHLYPAGRSGHDAAVLPREGPSEEDGMVVATGVELRGARAPIRLPADPRGPDDPGAAEGEPEDVLEDALGPRLGPGPPAPER